MENLVGRPNPQFWAGRNVLVTGHTGFKGAWAVRLLAMLGAKVTGFALDPAQDPSPFATLGIAPLLQRDLRGDLRDPVAVADAVAGADVVLHMAAQAIVSQGYRDPAGTWASNVTGTLHVLQALRGSGAQAAVIVTSDKVYRNDGTVAFREADALGGDDPYSASKAACEILVASHRASYDTLPPLATARAGNVLGGGDFGTDRLIPDLVRAQRAGTALVLRHPDATRPFQHVLDVLSGYLLLAEGLVDRRAPVAVNFGPSERETSVRTLLDHWQAATGKAVLWHQASATPLAEKPRLALDSTLARDVLGWSPRKTTRQTMTDTAMWYQQWAKGDVMTDATDTAIRDYLKATPSCPL